MIKQTSPFLVLYTPNIKLTHQFYREIGGDIKELSDDKLVVGFGFLEFHFILNTSEPFEGYRYITIPQSYGQGVIFYLETDNIAEAENKILTSGGTIKAPTFNNLWDCKELLFEDPNGYKFALYQSKTE